MIRIVTRARLARLSAEAKEARDRASQVREQADAAFSTHLRTVAELSGRAETAERDRAAYAGVVTALRAELDAAPELQEIVLLVRFGQPHSIHRSVYAAQACAGTHGADPAGWRSCSGAPSASAAWATIVFTFDAATDAFMCSVVPSLPVPGGAG
ncbi:hypothetical protein [Streptomyces sp. NPDC048411]|uniref:hypothetical protein n=1 Tax=Streptomyces sp. NPDC048411 TaxID=3157206 RepID=UPI003456AB5E